MKKQDLLIVCVVLAGVTASLLYLNAKKKKEEVASKVPGATMTDKV